MHAHELVALIAAAQVRELRSREVGLFLFHVPNDEGHRDLAHAHVLLQSVAGKNVTDGQLDSNDERELIAGLFALLYPSLESEPQR